MGSVSNGCGPGTTSVIYTISLGMAQSNLWGTSPTPGGFASTGSFWLSSAQAPQGCTGLAWPLSGS